MYACTHAPFGPATPPYTTIYPAIYTPAGCEPRAMISGRARPLAEDGRAGTLTAMAEDSYTGDVSVGGPVDTRELPGLTVTKVAVGPMDNNAYLLRCTSTGDVLLIDAANEPERLLHELDDARLTCIVTTHRHYDHWQALPELVAATGAPVVAHPADAGELPVDVATLVDDGDTVQVGDCTLQVVHLVGHTPGSIALLYDADGALADAPHLFTGDSLFPGGPGNTFGDPVAFETLMDDLERKVFGPLPDETWVYPGHGKDTVLGVERPAIPEWRARGW